MQKVNNKWKTTVTVLACITVVFVTLFGWQLTKNTKAPVNNGKFTDEMKIAYAVTPIK